MNPDQALTVPLIRSLYQQLALHDLEIRPLTKMHCNKRKFTLTSDAVTSLTSVTLPGNKINRRGQYMGICPVLKEFIKGHKTETEN
jgi:hypothetical protein